MPNTFPNSAARTKTVCLSLGAISLAFAVSALADPPAPFTEEAVSRGVVYFINEVRPQFGAGVAFCDLDGDGDPDIVTMGKSGGQVGLFENDGTGHFTDRSATSGIPATTTASGIAAADYDADGDLDLYITNYHTADFLMRNDGGMSFTNVASGAGMGSTGACAGLAWGDIDNDNWLDLYVCTRTGENNNWIRNHLYQNQGDGTFVDVAETLNITDGDAPSLISTFFDYDRDGDADMYLGNDKGSAGNWPTRLFQNQGDGTFVEVAELIGAVADVDCMGTAIGDITRDGFSEIYLTNLPFGNAFFVNQGDGTFINYTTPAGLNAYTYGWATMFLDYDNDGWLELHLCTINTHDQMFEHDGVWPATEISSDVGLTAYSNSYCSAQADVDGDGDIDLLVSPGFQANIQLFVNHEGENRNWVKFNVVGHGANTFGVGTIVDIRTGSIWRMREVFAGTNYKSQNSTTLHFGIDTATMIDTIVVNWLGGTTRTLRNYTANETWTLYPKERLGDADGDGDIDHADLVAFEGCYTGPGPGNLTPGCEMMDIDGDGDVDEIDRLLMKVEIHSAGVPSQPGIKEPIP